MNVLNAIAIPLLLMAFSCKDGVQGQPKQQVPPQQDSIASITTETIAVNTSADTLVQLDLREMTVLFNGLEVETYDYDSIRINDAKDSAILSIALGEAYEHKSISVQSDVLTDIIVQQRYETSVTIMNEGPRCDLINWKHYNSPWIALSPDKYGTYHTQTYTEKEWSRFVPVTAAELKKAVKRHCDERWYELVKNAKSVNEYPATVSISRIFLRITGKRKDNGRQVVKIISAEMPMGC